MENIFSEGIKLYKERKFQDSLSFFLGIPSDSVENKNDLAYFIGLSYARLGRYEDSLMYLEQVVTNGAEKSKVEQCTLTLAVIYSMTNRSRMAEFELGKLEEMGIDSEQVLCTKGFVAWYKKDTDHAVQCYEEVLKKNPENATALNGLGYVLACSGRDLTRALFLCKKAVDLNPQSGACLDSLGWVYFNLGLMNEAENFVKRALEKMPGNAEITEHLNEIRGAEK